MKADPMYWELLLKISCSHWRYNSPNPFDTRWESNRYSFKKLSKKFSRQRNFLKILGAA
jgi:hypothetical protein